MMGLSVLCALNLSAQEGRGKEELRERAEQAYSAGQLMEALPEYEKLVSLFPEEGCLHGRLAGCALAEPGQMALARRHLRIANRMGCSDVDLEFHRARLAQLEYDFDRARDLYAAYLNAAGKKGLFKEKAELWATMCGAAVWSPDEAVGLEVLDRISADPDAAFRFYRPETPGLRLVNVPSALRSKADLKTAAERMAFHDGDTLLVFSSLGKKGQMGWDLFRISLSGGEYGATERLSDVVNTEFDERDAYLSPDGVLYFSSNRPGGLGGLDIYAVGWAGGKPEGEPYRLPFPINSVNDDAFFIPEPDGGAWFASNRAAAGGRVHAFRVALSDQPFVAGSVAWVEEEVESESLTLRVYENGEVIRELDLGQSPSNHVSLDEESSGVGVRWVLEDGSGQIVSEAFGSVDTAWELQKQGSGWTMVERVEQDWAMLADLQADAEGRMNKGPKDSSISNPEGPEGEVGAESDVVSESSASALGWSAWVSKQIESEEIPAALGASEQALVETKTETTEEALEEDLAEVNPSTPQDSPVRNDQTVDLVADDLVDENGMSSDPALSRTEELDGRESLDGDASDGQVGESNQEQMDTNFEAIASESVDAEGDVSQLMKESAGLSPEERGAFIFENQPSPSQEHIDAWRVQDEEALVALWESKLQRILELETVFLDDPDMATAGEIYDLMEDLESWQPQADLVDASLKDGADFEGIRNMLDTWSYAVQSASKASLAQVAGEAAMAGRREKLALRELLDAGGTDVASLMMRWADWVDARRGVKGVEEDLGVLKVQEGDALMEEWSLGLDASNEAWSRKERAGWRGEWLSRQEQQWARNENVWLEARSEMMADSMAIAEAAAKLEAEEAAAAAMAAAELEAEEAAAAMAAAELEAEEAAAAESLAAVEAAAVQAAAEAKVRSDQDAAAAQALAASEAATEPQAEQAAAAVEAQASSTHGEPEVADGQESMVSEEVDVPVDDQGILEWVSISADPFGDDDETTLIGFVFPNSSAKNSGADIGEADSQVTSAWAGRITDSRKVSRAWDEFAQASGGAGLPMVVTLADLNSMEPELKSAYLDLRGTMLEELDEWVESEEAKGVQIEQQLEELSVLSFGTDEEQRVNGLSALLTKAQAASEAMRLDESESPQGKLDGEELFLAQEKREGLALKAAAAWEALLLEWDEQGPILSAAASQTSVAVAAQPDDSEEEKEGQEAESQTEADEDLVQAVDEAREEPAGMETSADEDGWVEAKGPTDIEAVPFFDNATKEEVTEWMRLLDRAVEDTSADEGGTVGENAWLPEDLELIAAWSNWRRVRSRNEDNALSRSKMSRWEKSLFFAERDVREAWERVDALGFENRLIMSSEPLADSAMSPTSLPEGDSGSSLVEVSAVEAVDDLADEAVDDSADGSEGKSMEVVADETSTSASMGLNNSPLNDVNERRASAFGVVLPAAEVVGQGTSSGSGVAIRPIDRVAMERAILGSASLDLNEGNSAAETFAVESGAPRSDGVEYKIQIGAFRKALPAALFAAFNPMWAQSLSNGITRYMAGSFDAYDPAVVARDAIRSLGYDDAFVVRFVDGERVRGSRPPVDELAQERVNQQASSRATASNEPQGELGESTVDPAGVVATSNAPSTAQNIPTWNNIRGRVYSVQVGAFRGVPDENAVAKLGTLTREDAGTDGWLRLFSGRFEDEQSAAEHRDELRLDGREDAFVVVYINGKRIPLLEASTTAVGSLVGMGEAAPSETGSEQKASQDEGSEGVMVGWEVELGEYSSTIPVRLANAILDAPLGWGIRSLREQGFTRYITRKSPNQSEAQSWLNQAKEMGFDQARLIESGGN